MIHSIAAVTAAALCAGMTVGFYPNAAPQAPAVAANAFPAIVKTDKIVQTDKKMPATKVAPITNPPQAAADACAQGWPYFPAECLQRSGQVRTVRVISLASTAPPRADAARHRAR